MSEPSKRKSEGGMTLCDAGHSTFDQEKCSGFMKSTHSYRCMFRRFDRYCDWCAQFTCVQEYADEPPPNKKTSTGKTEWVNYENIKRGQAMPAPEEEDEITQSYNTWGI